MNPLRVQLKERFDNEIMRWRHDARIFGGPLNMLRVRLSEYRERTQGLTPRAVLVGEVFFHEIQNELLQTEKEMMQPIYWMSPDERARRTKDCPIPTEAAVGVLQYRNLWIVGNYSQQDAFVFIQ